MSLCIASVLHSSIFCAAVCGQVFKTIVSTKPVYAVAAQTAAFVLLRSFLAMDGTRPKWQPCKYRAIADTAFCAIAYHAIPSARHMALSTLATMVARVGVMHDLDEFTVALCKSIGLNTLMKAVGHHSDKAKALALWSALASKDHVSLFEEVWSDFKGDGHGDSDAFGEQGVLGPQLQKSYGELSKTIGVDQCELVFGDTSGMQLTHIASGKACIVLTGACVCMCVRAQMS